METLVIIKPDAVERNIDGILMTKLRDRGCFFIKGELILMTRRQANDLYQKFAHETWIDGLIDFMVSGLCWVMVVDHRHENAIAVVRELIGAPLAPKPQKLPGTIRGDYGENYRRNVIHGSDSAPEAEREIRIFFPGFYDQSG